MNNIKLDKFHNFLELKNFKEAEVEIIKLLNIEPNSYLLLTCYANVLFLQNNF